jgi:hypothetical protein
MLNAMLKQSVKSLEDDIAAAYEAHLIASRRLTTKQARDAEYSHAIPEVRPGPERASAQERKRRFRAFAVDSFKFRLDQSRELIRVKLCVDAEYCKNKNGEGLTIVVASVDGIISTVVGYPIPAATVTAWLLKTKWLDKLCECPVGGFMASQSESAQRLI